jgi:hypothetical protein
VSSSITFLIDYLIGTEHLVSRELSVPRCPDLHTVRCRAGIDPKGNVSVAVTALVVINGDRHISPPWELGVQDSTKNGTGLHAPVVILRMVLEDRAIQTSVLHSLFTGHLSRTYRPMTEEPSVEQGFV